MTNALRSPDYQQYQIGADGNITNIGPRMLQKMQAIKLPDLKYKEVLDVGCDFGFWSFQSALLGAKRIVGLDRNRDVRGMGQTNLIEINREVSKTYPVYHQCEFYEINLGKQYFEYGKFDVIYLFSLYHHIYQNTGGDHEPIWYWLWRNLKPDGMLIWENPETPMDVVVQKNVSPQYHQNYNPSKILGSALHYFEGEHVGPALHEPTREVYRFFPKSFIQVKQRAIPVNGAGGASKAFLFEDGRRIREIENILGYQPYPGSLNLYCDHTFDWNQGYFRAGLLDVEDRSKGLESDWELRWARFYPVKINDIDGHVFRFEGEEYPKNFVEVVAPVRLRDYIKEKVVISR